MITWKDLYAHLVQLVVHSESISWSRFANYLTCNSILLLAWATLFVSVTHGLATRLVMALLCIIGGLSGVAWADLGRRGRAYLDQYKDAAVKIEEKEAKAWSEDIPLEYRLFQLQQTSLWYSRSRTLVIGVPYVFTVLYAILLVMSFIAEEVPNP